MIKAILLVIITLFLPPVGVFLVAGCGMDLFINIILTLLGYFPGHIHAYYVEYVYFSHRDKIRSGTYDGRRAPAVYSNKVQNGGKKNWVPAQAAPIAAQGVPVQYQQQGIPVQHQQQQPVGLSRGVDGQMDTGVQQQQGYAAPPNYEVIQQAPVASGAVGGHMSEKTPAATGPRM